MECVRGHIPWSWYLASMMENVPTVGWTGNWSWQSPKSILGDYNEEGLQNGEGNRGRAW